MQLMTCMFFINDLFNYKRNKTKRGKSPTISTLYGMLVDFILNRFNISEVLGTKVTVGIEHRKVKIEFGRADVRS